MKWLLIALSALAGLRWLAQHALYRRDIYIVEIILDREEEDADDD